MAAGEVAGPGGSEAGPAQQEPQQERSQAEDEELVLPSSVPSASHFEEWATLLRSSSAGVAASEQPAALSEAAAENASLPPAAVRLFLEVIMG